MNDNQGTKIVLFIGSSFFALLGIIILCCGGIGFGLFVMSFAIILFGFGFKEHLADIKIKEHIKLLNESFNRSVAAFGNKISYESVNRARKDVFGYIAILSEEEYKEKRNLLPYSQMCIATTTADLDNLTFAILHYHYADFTPMIKELKEAFKITGNINWGELKRSMFYFLTKEHDVNTLDIKDEKNVQFIKSVCDIIESSIERIRIEPKRLAHSSAPTPTISETEKLILARESLIAYYMTSITDLIYENNENINEDDELTKQEREVFKTKKSLIESSIREYIKDKEVTYGSDFLAKKPIDESNQNHILNLISKYSFCVSLYYTMGFDTYPAFSKKEVCLAIQEVLDEPSSASLSNNDFKLAILKRLN